MLTLTPARVILKFLSPMVYSLYPRNLSHYGVIQRFEYPTEEPLPRKKFQQNEMTRAGQHAASEALHPFIRYKDLQTIISVSFELKMCIPERLLNISKGTWRQEVIENLRGNRRPFTHSRFFASRTPLFSTDGTMDVSDILAAHEAKQ